MWDKKQHLEPDIEQRTGSRVGKEKVKAYIVTCLFNVHADYIMQIAGLDETQVGIKIAGRKNSNLRYADDTTLIAESEKELKSLLMKVKEDRKSWLEIQHSKNEDHPSVQFRSVAQSCQTLSDPMNSSTSGLCIHHQHPEFTQTHVHRVGDSIQASHPLSAPSPPAPNPSQQQSLFQ